MSFWTVLTIVSTICSILSFFTSKMFKSHLWVWSVVVFILTFTSGYAIHCNSELVRIKNIHRQAMTIYKHYDSYSIDMEYVQEVLLFLEENRERYPDAYKRATQVYLDNKTSLYQRDTATQLRGIIKGIATLNEE